MAYPQSFRWETAAQGWSGWLDAGAQTYHGDLWTRELPAADRAAEGFGLGYYATQGLSSAGEKYLSPGNTNDATQELDFQVRAYTAGTRGYGPTDAADILARVMGASGPAYFQLVVWESDGSYAPAGQQFLTWRARPDTIAADLFAPAGLGFRIDQKLGKWLRLQWRTHVTLGGADDGATLTITESDGTVTHLDREDLGFDRDTLQEFRWGFAQPEASDTIHVRLDDYRVGTTAQTLRIQKTYALTISSGIEI